MGGLIRKNSIKLVDKMNIYHKQVIESVKTQKQIRNCEIEGMVSPRCERELFVLLCWDAISYEIYIEAMSILGSNPTDFDH